MAPKKIDPAHRNGKARVWTDEEREVLADVLIEAWREPLMEPDADLSDPEAFLNNRIRFRYDGAQSVLAILWPTEDDDVSGRDDLVWDLIRLLGHPQDAPDIVKRLLVTLASWHIVVA